MIAHTVVVLDANILLRLTDTNATQHPVAVEAVRRLAINQNTLVIVPQSCYEFWVVATRPIENNGMGLSVPACEARLDQLLSRFPMRDDANTMFTSWRELVTTFECSGKIAHDARYVAAMKTHGITHILTLNGKDFARFPDITVLDPHALVSTTP